MLRRARVENEMDAELRFHTEAMIIGPALALACGLVANLLLRMITISLKTLSTVAATVMLHQALRGRMEGAHSLRKHH